MKLAVLLLLGVSALVLGSMAGAWRRACLRISTKVHKVPYVTNLSPKQRQRFVPGFVSTRQLVAVVLLITTGVLAGILYGWIAGVLTFVGLWIAAEALALLYPKPDHPYYLIQITSEMEERRQLLLRFGQDSEAQTVQNELDVLRQLLAEEV